MTSIFKLLKPAFFLTLLSAEGMASPSSLGDWEEEELMNSTSYSFVPPVVMQANASSSSSSSSPCVLPMDAAQPKSSAAAKRKSPLSMEENPFNTSVIPACKMPLLASQEETAAQEAEFLQNINLDFLDFDLTEFPSLQGNSATSLSLPRLASFWDTLFPSTATSTQQDMSSVDLSQWELGFLPFNHSNQPPTLNQSADSSTTTALTSSSFSASAIIPLQSAPASSAHMTTSHPIENEDFQWEVDDISSSASTDESEEEWSPSEVSTNKKKNQSMEGNKKELSEKPFPLKKTKCPKTLDQKKEMKRKSNSIAAKKYRARKKERLERLDHLRTLAQKDSSLAESLSLIEKGLTTTLLEESKRRDLEKKAIDTNLTPQQRKRELNRLDAEYYRNRVQEELKLLDDYLAGHPEKANKDEDETQTLKQSWTRLIIEALKDSALKERNPDKKWKVADAIAFLENTEKFTDFFGDNPSSKSSTITQILQKANIWQMSQKGCKHKESVIDLDASTQIPHSGANIAGYLRAYAEHRGGPHLYTLGQATEVLKNSGRFESLFGNKYSKNLITDALKRAKPPFFKYTNEAESSTNSSTSTSASATAVPSTYGQVMDESEEEALDSTVPPLLYVPHGLLEAYDGSSLPL